MWTWVAIDADTKLVPSWLVGERTTEDCYTFLPDLRSRMLPGQRIQLTTDGFGSYPPVVDALWRDGIDDADGQGLRKRPDSYVERQNLTMRMGMRRFTRLTNGFSKKVENHAHAVSLHFMHYNFCRPHQTLTNRRKDTRRPLRWRQVGRDAPVPSRSACANCWTDPGGRRSVSPGRG